MHVPSSQGLKPYSKTFNPLLDLGLAAARGAVRSTAVAIGLHLVAVDAPAGGDFGFGESLLHVVHATPQAAALVGGEGDDGLAVEVDVAEEGEHDLRVGAPPHGAADEDGVVLSEVGSLALVGGQLAVGGLFLGQVDERHVGHAVVLVGDDLILVGTRDFADVVGHNLGVADLDVAHAVVIARVGEEDDYFVHCFIV